MCLLGKPPAPISQKKLKQKTLFAEVHRRCVMHKSHHVLGKQSVVTHITRWLVGLRNFGPLHCFRACSHVAAARETLSRSRRKPVRRWFRRLGLIKFIYPSNQKVRAVTCEQRRKAPFFGSSVRRRKKSGVELLISSLLLYFWEVQPKRPSGKGHTSTSLPSSNIFCTVVPLLGFLSVPGFHCRLWIINNGKTF